MPSTSIKVVQIIPVNVECWAGLYNRRSKDVEVVFVHGLGLDNRGECYPLIDNLDDGLIMPIILEGSTYLGLFVGDQQQSLIAAQDAAEKLVPQPPRARRSRAAPPKGRRRAPPQEPEDDDGDDDDDEPAMGEVDFE